MFSLNIQGDLGTVLPTEIQDPNKAFGKAWVNFLQEAETAGVKLTTAKIENAGKTISLPVEVHAHGPR